MLRKISLVTLILVLFVQLNQAQNTWTLEKCITHAQENSITLQQAEIGIKNAVLTKKQSEYSRLPSFNFRGSAGIQFGRTIDPTTNSFDNANIGFNSMSLDGGLVLYNGNQVNNSIKKSKVDLEIAKLDAEVTSDNLMLTIATAYLGVLMGKEQLSNAKSRKKLTEQQLEQLDKLIQAGALPKNDRLNLLAQMALDEQTIIQAQNAVVQGLLNIQNLLQLEPSNDFDIHSPDVDVLEQLNVDKFEEVLSAAFSNQPQIQAIPLRQRSAQLDEKLAKAATLPSLSVFGNIDSRWSSASKDFENPDLSNTSLELGTALPANIDGTDVSIATYNLTGIVFPEKSYADQLNENFGQAVGLSLNIPIYNNGRNRINLERTKLNSINADLMNEQTKQQLKNDVLLAMGNARASKQAYDAAIKSLDAMEKAYEDARRKYDLGAISTFDFSTSKTNLDNAETEVIRSKYDAVFRQKILDFYMGKPLKL